MHIQARARVKSSTLGGGPDDAIEAPYTLAGLLKVLADEGYSLRSASGQNIEHGGEFAFRVRAKTQGGGSDAPPGDPDDDVDDRALREAIAFLQGKDVEVREVRVYHEDLPDKKGALQAFVERVAKKDPILEISIATQNPDGTVPVQIYTGRSLEAGEG